MESNLRHLIAKMTKEKCILCGKETVSVIKTGTDFMCYNCYADQRNPTRSKEVHNNEEARIQTEFFKLIPLYFPNIPDKLIFAVPNGGSRHIREAANLKRQGVKPGVSDVIVLIPKKGFASLCIEFKTKVGKQSEYQKEFQKQAESCRNKCNHTIFRHANFIGCLSADKIKMPVRKYFCFNIPVYRNMAEEPSCRSPYHEEYIQTSVSGNSEGLCRSTYSFLSERR